MGHVRKIGLREIILDKGSIPTDERTLHVHCAASALVLPPLRPIFEARRVTVQVIHWGYACYQFATQGVIEAKAEIADEVKNTLATPIPYWDKNEDYVSSFLATLIGDRTRATHPALASWIKTSRLNPSSGLSVHRDDPRVIEARECIKRCGMAAAMNLQKLLETR
jgi:hypothetical protein